MTILKLRQANNPESTTKLAYIRELCAILGATVQLSSFRIFLTNSNRQKRKKSNFVPTEF